MKIDLFFTYKYVLRFLLINKLGIFFNTYEIPYIKKLFFLFYLNKLEDIDEVQIYNNFYLLKYFFGRNAFFIKSKKYFTLGVWYYNINIQLILNNKKDILLLLYLYFNNIHIHIELNLFKYGCLNKKLNIFYFLIKDLNVYSELKTNLGLFNIKSSLNINIYIKGASFENSMILLNILKIS